MLNDNNIKKMKYKTSIMVVTNLIPKSVYCKNFLGGEYPAPRETLVKVPSDIYISVMSIFGQGTLAKYFGVLRPPIEQNLTLVLEKVKLLKKCPPLIYRFMLLSKCFCWLNFQRQEKEPWTIVSSSSYGDHISPLQANLLFSTAGWFAFKDFNKDYNFLALIFVFTLVRSW